MPLSRRVLPAQVVRRLLPLAVLAGAFAGAAAAAAIQLAAS